MEPQPIFAETDAAAREADCAANCCFCGQLAGLHAMRCGGGLACVLCGLVQSLYRPEIDKECLLVWLPEMSQADLNVLVRQVHLDLQALAESVDCDVTPSNPAGMRPVLYMAQRILAERSEVIEERLGSSRVGNFTDALTALVDRDVRIDKIPLGGLRIFPTGRFFVDGVNVYENIVESWLEPGKSRERSIRSEQLPETV